MRSVAKSLLTTVLAAVLMLQTAALFAGPIMLASTNRGELVAIDPDAGTGTVLGQAATPPGRGSGWGWADLAMDSNGNLFGVSRALPELPGNCIGIFATGSCSHLYEIDPSNGQVLNEVGSMDVAFVSDITFDANGDMQGNYFVDDQVFGQGSLLGVDETNAQVTPAPNLFGGGLENGGLAQDPVTEVLWGIESSYSFVPSLFQINPVTGVASNVLQLTQGGGPVEFGFDSLEILGDGRFFATRGAGSSELYLINPFAGGGTAEVTLVPLTFDRDLEGSLNGLTRTVPEPGTLGLLALGLIGGPVSRRILSRFGSRQI